MLVTAQRTAGNAAVVQRLRDRKGVKVELESRSDPFLLSVVAQLDKPRKPAYVMVDGVKFLIDAGDAVGAKDILMTRQKKVMKKAHRTSPYTHYDEYAASLRRWERDRGRQATVALQTGSYLYHGTTKATALIVQAGRLEPAEPHFRKGAWDGSKDGFLSMATALGGATPGIVLRMRIADGDVDDFAFKRISGTEVVTRHPILPERLQWAVPAPGAATVWRPLSDLD